MRRINQGGKGVVVGGCPACKKRLNSMNQYLDPSGKRRDAGLAGEALERVRAAS